jgi:hypothetical protein
MSLYEFGAVLPPCRWQDSPTPNTHTEQHREDKDGFHLEQTANNPTGCIVVEA